MPGVEMDIHSMTLGEQGHKSTQDPPGQMGLADEMDPLVPGR